MEHAPVRPFEEADTEAVVGLSLRAWEPVFASFELVLGPDLYRHMFPEWRTYQATSVREALAQNETWVVDADAGATVAGFVNVTFDTDESLGEIYMIAVDPDLQRQGVAGRLTDFAVAEMKRRGMALALVATGGDPGHAPARTTYEKAGFTPFPQVSYYRLLTDDG